MNIPRVEDPNAGAVYVECQSVVEAAVAATHVVGRWYSNRTARVSFIPGTDYAQIMYDS